MDDLNEDDNEFEKGMDRDDPNGIEEEGSENGEDGVDGDEDSNNNEDRGSTADSSKHHHRSRHHEEQAINTEYVPPNRKMKLLASLEPASMPASYQSNTPEESLVLDYIENFRRQFTQLFPSRPELLLCPRNECGVPKCICCTVRPTQLPYKDLYDVEACAGFLADFLEYEPLNDPLKLPSYLPSPCSTIQWQLGDCLDFAVTLASFLIGGGYDAYCVSGYAPREITMADQSHISCPELEMDTSAEDMLDKKKGNGDDDGEKNAASKAYAIKPRPQLHSTHILKNEQLRLFNEKFIGREHIAQEEEEQDFIEPDPYDGKRVHCWVLVLAGKREVPADIFVEPSTGRVFPVTASPYQRIECVWNHKNYWVNMQDPKLTVANLRLDLNDFNRWEFVFLESTMAGADKDEDDHGQQGQPPVKWEQGGMTGPDVVKETDKVIDLAPCWFPKLEIDRDAYLSRCANGVKKIKYRKALVEKFSESSRPDGMVKRTTIYSDIGMQNVIEIREAFSSRRDRLEQRIHLPKQKTRTDHFSKGRMTPDALKALIEAPNQREFIFYSSARLDGMVKRVEVYGSKIIETFEGRDDRLNYRSLTYEKGNIEDAIAAKREQAPGGEIIRKMCEKFDRDASIDADNDVRRRIFMLAEKKITLDFHYGSGRITAAARVFHKDGKSVSYSVDPFSKQERSSALRDQFQRLLQSEKDCMQAFRDSDRASKELLALRKKEEDNIYLNKSLYEQLKLKQSEEASKPVDEEVETSYKQDYLAPYLAKNLKNAKTLTRMEAMAAKDACLNALRERLIDRSHIIESRLEEEQQQLARRQAGYQRQDKDKTAEEEYERYVQEATFRIQILKQRRDRHDEMAKQKFKDMVQMLAQDTRLAVLNDQPRSGK